MMRYFYSVACLFILSLPSLAWASCPNKFFDESCSCAPPPNGYCISAGNKKFTYYKIAEDLKHFVAPDSGFNLKVMEGGSVQNLKRMRWQNGVKFSIIQSDVLEFYRAQQESGNPVAAKIIEPLRAIMPLYNEEIHILVKADSDINTYSDLKGKRMALGKLGGGTAVTIKSIYKYMFGVEMANSNIHFTPKDMDSVDDGLSALAKNSVDAWVMVVGQGTERIANFLPEAAKHFKFVKFNITNPQEEKALQGPYLATSISTSSYPWLLEDTPTLTTKAILITQRYTTSASKRNIKRFTQALCTNFGKLQAEGNSKWQEVELGKAELPNGWEYSQDALDAFNSEACGFATTKASDCSAEEAVLNLCISE